MAAIATEQPLAFQATDREVVDWRQRMLGDLGESQRCVSAGGVATTYYEAGNGPPLVLLHGAIECGGVIWTPVVPALARHYRVIVPDVPGLGESEPPDRLDPVSFSDWLVGFCRTLDVSAPVVVAHSLVGALALRHAVSHSDHLQRLVVSASPGIGRYRMPLRLIYVAIRLQLRPTPKNDERFARFALLDLNATHARHGDWYDAFSAYSVRRGATPHVKRTMNALIRTCTRRIPDAELRRIKIPVDLLWGNGDRMVPLALARGASQRLGWSLHRISGAAHAPQIEQPEAFVETLLHLLEAGGDAAGATPTFGSPNGFAMSVTEVRTS